MLYLAGLQEGGVAAAPPPGLQAEVLHMRQVARRPLLLPKGRDHALPQRRGLAARTTVPRAVLPASIDEHSHHAANACEEDERASPGAAWPARAVASGLCPAVAGNTADTYLRGASLRGVALPAAVGVLGPSEPGRASRLAMAACYRRVSLLMCSSSRCPFGLLKDLSAANPDSACSSRHSWCLEVRRDETKL